MSQPHVIFIHGMWSTDQTLLPIRRIFEAWGFACHSPLLPCHGSKDNAAEVARLSHLDYVNFLKGYIAQLKLSEPPILVGHSLGGLLVQLVAAQIPTRALVLLAAAAPAGINALSISSIRSTLHASTKWKFWEKAHRPPTLAVAQYALFNNLPLKRQQELFDALVWESGRVLFEAGFAMLDSHHATRVDFAKIQVPMLLLHGTDDRIVIVQCSRQVVKKYPRATLKEYPGAGHWFFEEPVSKQVFADTRAWLEQVL